MKATISEDKRVSLILESQSEVDQLYAFFNSPRITRVLKLDSRAYQTLETYTKLDLYNYLSRILIA